MDERYNINPSNKRRAKEFIDAKVRQDNVQFAMGDRMSWRKNTYKVISKSVDDGRNGWGFHEHT